MTTSAESERSLEAAVADLTLAIGQLVRRVRSEVDPSDYNLSQLSVLSRIERHGALTTADLARAESMKPQSMGALVVGLEQAGLVERQPHPSDGRQWLIALTPAGAAVSQQRRSAKRAWLLEAVRQLSDEERSALRAATPLLRRLAER
ncbi:MULTISPECIES: MarR family transcriptional regulator [Burkholderia]|jgi:DNA-binding MarR family transcriptional regulator|uniref:MarR family protein n=1 Tax=Burkholderia gladioli TaxID=28095 RepID=A0AAW3F385_BURGA|nr:MULTISPECIES: MarR family transcriptional regulator [Burkholderia]AJW96332.1 marR family protein [Burkholderia gladioli]ASD83175.1 MarR family transcriptional regulator [Burkholderia gladioli pv. gladioli]AWY50604.1 MarR family transcriptional regulator [Burkholderia gladioli pv. gladioli]AYQ89892.1 MarR family transcriptional regulator [Burkholderia gladioli]KAF1059311.1 putative HTH-type transcriptional regulator [Burkholderia gladioli]